MFYVQIYIAFSTFDNDKMITEFAMPSHVIYFHHYLRCEESSDVGEKKILLWCE